MTADTEEKQAPKSQFLSVFGRKQIQIQIQTLVNGLVVQGQGSGSNLRSFCQDLGRNLVLGGKTTTKSRIFSKIDPRRVF